MQTLKLNQQYLNFNNPNTRILVIESGKGTGKTRWMQDNLAEIPALFLSHRIALTKDLANRTGSAHYLDNSAHQSKRLVICVNSLMSLLHSDTHKGATLVIDECTQVLRHLIGETCSVNRQEILNALGNKVYNCSQLILLDADMNQETLDYFVKLFNYKDVQVTPNDITWVTNSYKSKNRVFKEFPASESLQFNLLNDLKAGLNCYIACDTQSRVDTISSLIDASKVELKGKLTVHGSNSGQSQQADFIANVNELQKDYQAVIASPSLFTGVDISQPHFDKVYLFADGASATATDLLQASARVRTVSEVNFWVTTKRNNELTDWEKILDIKERIAFGTGWMNNVDYELKAARGGDVWAWDFDIATGTSKVRDGVYMTMFCQLQALQNKSLNDLHTSFLEAAAKEGRVVTHIPNENELKQLEVVKKTTKVVKQQNKQAKYEAILTAPDLNPHELFLLDTDADLLSAQESNSIKKHKLLELIGGLNDYLPEVVKNESKWYKAIYNQGLLIRNLEDLAQQDEVDVKTKAPSDRKYRVKTVNLIKEFLTRINYEGSLLRGEELSAFYAVDKYNAPIANHRWFINQAIQFKELLNISVPKDIAEKPFQFIQAILNTLGLSTIDKQVTVRKGDVMIAMGHIGIYPDTNADEKIRIRKYYIDSSSVKVMNSILEAREAKYNKQKQEELVGLPF
jgi:hypothetical protein